MPLRPVTIAYSEKHCRPSISFSVEATVSSYHTYKDIWAAVLGEELPCQTEVGNRVDTFAVALIAISVL